MLNSENPSNSEDRDLILFCDGSGTILEKPCGSAAILYDCSRKQTTELQCGFSNGTNNFAELIPILYAIYWRRTFEQRNKIEPSLKKWLIVSDSEVTVRTGNGQYKNDEFAGLAPLWAAIRFAVAQFNYRLSFLHVPRNSNVANARCDELAGLARFAMVDLIKAVPNAPFNLDFCAIFPDLSVDSLSLVRYFGTMEVGNDLPTNGKLVTQTRGGLKG